MQSAFQKSGLMKCDQVMIYAEEILILRFLESVSN